MEKELNRLYTNLWTTKGSRFIASKRFAKHNKLSNLTITIASVYILALNLIILIPDSNKFLSEEHITYFTICSSILVLALSLVVNSRNYQSLSDKFHDCGREISEVYDTICLLRNSTPSIQQIESIHSNYQAIIRKYDINQDQLDFDIFRSRNLNEFPEFKYPTNASNIKHVLVYLNRVLFKLKTLIKLLWNQYVIYFCIWLLPACLFLIRKSA